MTLPMGSLFANCVTFNWTLLNYAVGEGPKFPYVKDCQATTMGAIIALFCGNTITIFNQCIIMRPNCQRIGLSSSVQLSTLWVVANRSTDRQTDRDSEISIVTICICRKLQSYLTRRVKIDNLSKLKRRT